MIENMTETVPLMIGIEIMIAAIEGEKIAGKGIRTKKLKADGYLAKDRGIETVDQIVEGNLTRRRRLVLLAPTPMKTFFVFWP